MRKIQIMRATCLDMNYETRINKKKGNENKWKKKDGNFGYTTRLISYTYFQFRP